MCVCVGVAGRLDEIIGNRNTHTHTLTHTHRRSSLRAGSGTVTIVILKWPVAPNNPVNTKVLKPSYASLTMVKKKITNRPVHVQRALIIFANSDGSGEPVYKTAQPSMVAHTIYDKDPTSWLRMCVQSLIPHDA